MKESRFNTEGVRWLGAIISAGVVLLLQLHLEAAHRVEATPPPPLRSVESVAQAAVIPAPEPVADPGESLAELLVESIIMIESGGDPAVVGRHGERGLMQIKSDTWREVTTSLYGRSLSFSRAFDPDINRRVGKAYLSKLHTFLVDHRGDWNADERSLLLACYNAGPGRVIQSGFALDTLPASTRDYIARVSAIHDDLIAERQSGQPSWIELSAASAIHRDT
ncbi:MAG: lytic transglycosylase domain-containing protein [Kiritimatiellae bacterium]|nr:lytic transglycosylase domain-containing protein [Kiritimatiellia bacterium]